ncbi:MAG: sulfatase-like hydrolase/transferase [Akkermansiaceae bacterium]
MTPNQSARDQSSNQKSDSPPGGSTLWFVAWIYAVTASFLLAFVLRLPPQTFLGWIFASLIILTYALMYSAPSLIAILLANWTRKKGKALRLIGSLAVILVAAISTLLLASDYVIHGMFGFHFNGFVWNLIRTPEGLESMGAGPETNRTYFFIVVAVFLVQGAIWWIANLKSAAPLARRLLGGRLKQVIVWFVLLTLTERITYGYVCLKAWPDGIGVSSTIPGYQPFTYRKLAKTFGIEMKRRLSVDAPRDDAALVYPLSDISSEEPEKPLNLVWLICESLRADMLDPEIMPETWAFAQESQRFTKHYSGGNGTRMGVFSAFYGLPGSYWFGFLHSRRSPLLMDRVQELNYDLRFSTSAAFSYPEFDKTIFSKVSLSNLHPLAKENGWLSDRYHVGEMKNWLREKQTESPYFLFHFFESSHARYYFPPESVIREPYLEDLNYATVNPEEDIDLIRNRYINSVHHLDSQLGEMIQVLRDKGDLENTIVLITGDHGEEFLENGRWGHNSEFTEQQVKVPLILHMPGRSPAVIDYPTSHLDFASTFLPLLGVTNPPGDYTTGQNLFHPGPRLLTFSDWNRIGICDGEFKASFPLRTGKHLGSKITTADDKSVDDEDTAMRKLGAQMVQLKDILTQFTKKH